MAPVVLLIAYAPFDSVVAFALAASLVIVQLALASRVHSTARHIPPASLL
jgi:hypothetical protein